MAYFQPGTNWYSGSIDFDSQPLTWIRKQRSFASKEWIEGQVKYGECIQNKSNPQHYSIYSTNFEETKPITILIKIQLLRTHVLVYHAHLLRNK